jgi:hypothetical protein
LNKKHEPILKQTKIWKIATAKNARLYRTRNFAKNPNLDLQDSKRQLETQLIFENRTKDLLQVLANGLRYPRVGGRGQCLRCRKNPKPEKCF